MRDLFVIVSGAPASGKTTLAKQLAPALDLPLVMKDTIKEAIADELGAPDVEASKKLGAATMRVLLALAKEMPGGVLESTWLPELARPQLRELKSPIIEVLCDVPVDYAIERYQARAGSRHPVHFDEEKLDPADFEARAQPIDGGWPVIRVDGTQECDIPAIVEQIEDALS
jgi:predicted kinase